LQFIFCQRFNKHILSTCMITIKVAFTQFQYLILLIWVLSWLESNCSINDEIGGSALTTVKSRYCYTYPCKPASRCGDKTLFFIS
jgi:hypothetical protein